MKRKDQIQVNQLSEGTKTSMKVRIISSIIAICIAVPAVLLGDWFFVGLIFILTLVGAREIINCAKPKHSRWLTVIAAIIILLLTFWPILRFLVSPDKVTDWTLYGSFETIYLSIFVLALGFLSLFWMVICDSQFSVKDACFVFTIGLVLALGFQSLLVVRFAPIYEHFYLLEGNVDTSYFSVFKNLSSSSLAFYIAVATFMTDAGAYFVGVFFGKHKMNPRISPKKTWEGFFGGIIISTVVSFLFAIILALTGNPILQIFDINHWYLILILSLIIPVFSTLGDLVFSSLKRHYDIKDFGKLIPGHGGVLDRVDSLLFAGIVSAIFISFVLAIYYGKGIPLL